MKIVGLTVVIGLEEEERTGIERACCVTCTRGADYLWHIDGPIYPRHLRFLQEIQEMAREVDVTGRSGQQEKWNR